MSQEDHTAMNTTTSEDAPSAPIEDESLGVALVSDLLRRGREERFQVVKLTDEELTVLDGVESRQLAPRPWFTTLEESSHEVALAVALRGLTIRGLVVPSLLDENTGRTSLDLDDDLHALLVARRAASSVVVAERRTQHASWSKTCYLQGAAGVVEEDVSPGGVHTLWAGPPDALPDTLTAFADPDGVAAPEPSEHTREVALTDVAQGTAAIAPSSEALFATVINRVYLDDDGHSAERRLSIFAGTDGLEIARSVQDGRKAVRIEQASPQALRSAVAHVLGQGS